MEQLTGRASRSRSASWGWGLAATFFVIYATLSVRRHQLILTTGYDLGIFEQAVRSYAHGRLPIAELKGPAFPLLGDHFSPITATIAPFYRTWPSPVTLLIAQATLLAVAAVPLTRWAHRTLGAAGALVVGVGYGASWGIAQTVGFDFHEVCFAVPLLAFSLEALGQERWRAAVAWVLPLLLVKEDLGLTVAAFGGYVAYRGRRKLGFLAVAAGLAGTVLEVLVLIPAYNPSGGFAYWDKSSGSGGPPADLLLDHAIGLAKKLGTVLMLLAPTAFLALRSPLILLTVPTLAWRFTSSNEAYWDIRFHYSAVLMPIVFAAFIDALAATLRSDKSLASVMPRRGALIFSSVFTALTLPLFPIGQLAEKNTWQAGPRITAVRHLLVRIPDGATVAASNRIVPQLTNRCTVTVFGSPNQGHPEWIVVDAATPQGWPISPGEQLRELTGLRTNGYTTVAETLGYVLLRRV
ncbi:DUF2079 domain-containing protein [Streptomyces sp. NBC_01410]|uniref:DUF2079 domain-containing protein n=1 Tax=Streptomyces sp. NBC_01410 TaxID=2903856 RepID=UPI003254D58A